MKNNNIKTAFGVSGLGSQSSTADLARAVSELSRRLQALEGKMSSMIQQVGNKTVLVSDDKQVELDAPREYEIG